MNKRFITKDRMVSLGAVLLGILVCFLTRTIPQSSIEGDIGSRAFPLLAAAVLILCGLLLMIQRTKGEQERYLLPFQWKRLFILFFSYVAFSVGLWVFGFVVSAPVFLFWLTCLLGKVDGKQLKYVQNVIYSIVLTALIYGLYQKVLRIPLPKGILFN